MKLQLRSGLRVEDLGDEALVMDTEAAKIHRVGGLAVQVLRLLAETSDPVEVPSELQDGIDELIEAGLVAKPTGWTRRKVLVTGGATWAAATVSTFALADPAAASTTCPAGITPTMGSQKYTTVGSSAMFVTGPAGSMASMSYSLLVRAWGGGGGGGGGSVDSTGGGGGGGEYRGGNITVNECTSYTVTVGGGGAGGGMPGGTGGSSSFGALLSATGGAGGTEPGSGSGTGGAGGTGGTGGSTNFDGGAGGNGSGTNAANSGTGGGGGGAGGSGGAGGMGGNGATGNNEGAAGAGGLGTPGGGAGGSGGDDGAPSGSTPGTPGGGAGGAEEALLGAGGGTGARGEVWVGV